MHGVSEILWGIDIPESDSRIAQGIELAYGEVDNLAVATIDVNSLFVRG